MPSRPLNRHKYWLCPYFKYDTATEMVGECGRVKFPLRTYANDYAEAYCAGNWQSCSIARYWSEYYEMIGDIKDDRKERTS